MDWLAHAIFWYADLEIMTGIYDFNSVLLSKEYCTSNLLVLLQCGQV